MVTGADTALTPQLLTACTLTTYVPGPTVPLIIGTGVENAPTYDPVTFTT
jgi:hypothetical protein